MGEEKGFSREGDKGETGTWQAASTCAQTYSSAVSQISKFSRLPVYHFIRDGESPCKCRKESRHWSFGDGLSAAEQASSYTSQLRASRSNVSQLLFEPDCLCAVRLLSLLVRPRRSRPNAYSTAADGDDGLKQRLLAKVE